MSITALLALAYAGASPLSVGYVGGCLPVIGFFAGLFGLASGLIIHEVERGRPWWWLMGMTANATMVAVAVLVYAAVFRRLM